MVRYMNDDIDFMVLSQRDATAAKSANTGLEVYKKNNEIVYMLRDKKGHTVYRIPDSGLCRHQQNDVSQEIERRITIANRGY